MRHNLNPIAAVFATFLAPRNRSAMWWIHGLGQPAALTPPEGTDYSG